MKKTQLKDSFRNIWKQKVSFLSIIVIAMLGVTTFLGIDFTAKGIRKNASDLYNRLNFRDVEVVSTLLFSEQDLESIRGVEGVTDVEPVRFTSAKATGKDTSVDINVISATERINRSEIKEGRLPAENTECAIEQQLADTLGVQIGDHVSLFGANGTAADYLKGTDFEVTGIVNHPDQTDLYVLVTWDAFDSDALGGCFMKTEIVINKPKNVDRFSKRYETSVAAVFGKIDELSVSCADRRTKELTESAQERISSAKTELENGFDQLEEAKASVREVIQNSFELAFKEDSDKKLVRWASARKADTDDPNETAKFLWITENIRIDLSRPIGETINAVLYSESIPEKFLVSLYESMQKESAPKKGGGEEYDLDKIRETLAGTAAASGGKYQELSSACMAWDAGHSEYISGLASYNDTMAKFEPCRWLSFDGRGNAGFVQFFVLSKNFSSLKTTFSLMFVLVGALVIFATIGKMVDEQRSLVGTTKALGFFNREIFAKYLCFGVTATAIGTVFGALIARFGIEPLLLNGFDKYFQFDLSKPVFPVSSSVIVFFAGILLAVIAIWFACAKLLREPAIRLMQAKTPGAKKGSAKRGKRVLSLYSRLILLNMRTDLKRVIVTIVSVAGCCALVVIGLTLKSAIINSVEKQYNGIVNYDLCVKYDPASSENAKAEIENALVSEGTEQVAVLNANATYRVTDLQIAELFCGDIQTINEFYHLNDWKTEKPIPPTNKGVLIQRRIAEIYGLDVGSELEIAIGGTKTATVRVAGVFENYIGRSIVMSAEYYETIYKEPCQANAFLVRLSGADSDRLVEKLQTIDGYKSVTRADADRSIVETSTSMINTVVALFIVIAAIMAGIVLLNLTNMYILQKKRELTIMRVNGFTVKEVIGYVLRETVITTILGILLGIVAGAGIAYRIIRTLEQSFIQFDRKVNVVAWLIAAVITVIFTVIVNAVALRKAKNLKLTDIA